jgi:myo-inositol-1-phosphate synthase
MVRRRLDPVRRAESQVSEQERIRREKILWLFHAERALSYAREVEDDANLREMHRRIEDLLEREKNRT